MLWAIGRVQPNTDWLPAELLDEYGFVRVTPELRLPDHRAAFAVGDVAATDPLCSSARNRGDALVAHNIRAQFAGHQLRSFRAPRRRWGSLVGIEPDGLEVFLPTGHACRIPSWPVERVVMPGVVRWGMYRGVQENHPFGLTTAMSAALATHPLKRSDALGPHADDAVVFQDVADFVLAERV